MSIVVDEEEAVVVEVVVKEDEGKEFSLPTIRRPADRRAMCRRACTRARGKAARLRSYTPSPSP